MALSIARVRGLAKTLYKSISRGVRATLALAVRPIYALLLKSPTLRRPVALVLRNVPGTDRLALRFLVKIGFYPAIAADMAEARGRSLIDGGTDFTQPKPPALSRRAALIADQLRRQDQKPKPKPTDLRP